VERSAKRSSPPHHAQPPLFGTANSDRRQYIESRASFRVAFISFFRARPVKCPSFHGLPVFGFGGLENFSKPSSIYTATLSKLQGLKKNSVDLNSVL
jgi:hypothetical protein